MHSLRASCPLRPSYGHPTTMETLHLNSFTTLHNFYNQPPTSSSETCLCRKQKHMKELRKEKPYQSVGGYPTLPAPSQQEDLERRLSSPNPRRDGGLSSPNPVQPAIIHDDRDGSQSSLNPAQSSTIRGGGAEDEDLRQDVAQSRPLIHDSWWPTRELCCHPTASLHSTRAFPQTGGDCLSCMLLQHSCRPCFDCSCILCTFVSCILHAPAGRMGPRRAGRQRRASVGRCRRTILSFEMFHSIMSSAEGVSKTVLAIGGLKR
jgi:hypothetical protein